MAKKNHYGTRRQAGSERQTGGDYRRKGFPYKTICEICEGDNYAMEKLIVSFEKRARQWARDIAENEFGLPWLYGYDEDMTQEIWVKLQTLLIRDFEITESRKETEAKFIKYVEKAIKNLLRNEIRKMEMPLRCEVCVDPYQIDNAFRKGSLKHDSGKDICIWRIEIAVRDKRLLEILEKGLGKMKDRHRQVLELAFIADYERDAIADCMNLKKKSVDNYLSEALGILKSCKKG